MAANNEITKWIDEELTVLEKLSPEELKSNNDEIEKIKRRAMMLIQRKTIAKTNDVIIDKFIETLIAEDKREVDRIFIPLADLYPRYVDYHSSISDNTPVSSKYFANKLREKGYDVSRRVYQIVVWDVVVKCFGNQPHKQE